MQAKATKRLLVGGVFLFWMILGALFGPQNVRSGLRLFVLMMMLLGLVLVVVEKIQVSLRTTRPVAQKPTGRSQPTGNPKRAYHAITARSEDGRMANGWVIGFVEEGKKGYSRQLEFGTFADINEAQEKADRLNADAGLSSRKANRMLNRWR
jgi:hypothetical protein